MKHQKDSAEFLFGTLIYLRMLMAFVVGCGYYAVKFGCIFGWQF